MLSETLDYDVRLNNATRIGTKDKFRKARTIIAKISILNNRQKCLRTGSNMKINEDVWVFRRDLIQLR